MSLDHKIPYVKERENKRECKWHDSWTPGTNFCVTFRNAIQKAISEGRLEFSEEKKPSQVDSNPFPEAPLVIMVSVYWRSLIEALSQMEEPATMPLPYSDESTFNEYESDVEPSYDRHSQAFFSQRTKITFKKRVKEVTVNLKPMNLVPRSWPWPKKEPRHRILKKVMSASKVREYI